jgi:hypothetical protein
MEYLEALRYSRCAEDVYELRRRVRVVRNARERETNKIDSVSPGPGREMIFQRRMRLYRMLRQLERRLQLAEEFRDYDWELGEREFIEMYGQSVSMRSVDAWRGRGVPLRLLREALRNNDR